MERLFRSDKFRTNLSRNYTNVYIIPLNTGAFFEKFRTSRYSTMQESIESIKFQRHLGSSN